MRSNSPENRPVRHKTDQLASAIQRAVQQIIARGLQDPRISGLITVTNVRVLSDLTQAIISVSVLPEDREELTIHGLDSAKAYVRREAGEIIRTRQLPTFVFKIDKSLKKQAAVLLQINKAMNEVRPTSEAPTTTPDASPGDTAGQVDAPVAPAPEVASPLTGWLAKPSRPNMTIPDSPEKPEVDQQ